MTLTVNVVSPEKVIWKGEATLVKCRAIDGDIAFLTGHAPYIGVLGQGEFEALNADGTRVRYQLEGGFVEVKDDNVIVLVEQAIDTLHQQLSDLASSMRKESRNAGSSSGANSTPSSTH